MVKPAVKGGIMGRLLGWFLLIFLWPFFAQGQLYDSHLRQWTEIENIAEQIEPGDTLVLGEIHDHPGHHQNQFLIMAELVKRGLSVSLGMEFFEYTKQTVLDKYLAGKLGELSFLEKMGWGSTPFSWYRLQVLLPLQNNGYTFAINSPRSITSKIAKSGLDSLTEQETEFLPPQFRRGNDLYFRRFAEAMGDHVPEDALHRYFTAQSVWDDTMAWQALQAHEATKSDVFVIIVGDFHASFGGGLPDRLRSRGARRVRVISQIDSTEMNQQEIQKEVEPHPLYGQRADWIWLTKRKESE